MIYFPVTFCPRASYSCCMELLFLSLSGLANGSGQVWREPQAPKCQRLLFYSSCMELAHYVLACSTNMRPNYNVIRRQKKIEEAERLASEASSMRCIFRLFGFLLHYFVVKIDFVLIWCSDFVYFDFCCIWFSYPNCLIMNFKFLLCIWFLLYFNFLHSRCQQVTEQEVLAKGPIFIFLPRPPNRL